MYAHCGYALLWSVQPLPLHSFTPLPLPLHFSTAFSIHPYILHLHRCYVLQYYWYSVILFFFLSFPEFHRVVTLLQTCSTSEFVYDHVCFVYVCLLELSFMYERRHAICEFLKLQMTAAFPQNSFRKTMCFFLTWIYLLQEIWLLKIAAYSLF
jgi:hypothetical protein